MLCRGVGVVYGSCLYYSHTTFEKKCMLVLATVDGLYTRNGVAALAGCHPASQWRFGLKAGWTGDSTFQPAMSTWLTCEGHGQAQLHLLNITPCNKHDVFGRKPTAATA